MKVTLETLRFILLFFILSMILGGIASLLFSYSSVNTVEYAVSFVVMVTLFFFYRKMGWGRVFNKKILLTSIVLVFLLSFFIPDMAPTLVSSSKYAYSYGFPFPFLTLYVEDGSAFFLPNLFAKDVTGWSAGIEIVGNFLLYYFFLHFLFNKSNHQANGLERKRGKKSIIISKSRKRNYL